MEVKFRYKGSSKSGNHGHAGREGKIGGSAKKSFQYPLKASYEEKPVEEMTINGKTGAVWIAASAAITQSRTSKLRIQLAKEAPGLDGPSTEKYIQRLADHRAAVLVETLRVSQHYDLTDDEQKQLIDNVLHHDTLDKYDVSTAVPYIDKIFNGQQKGQETKEFWKACNRHHDINPHHPEYWADERAGRAPQMPTENMVEMVGDWIATAKYFKTPIDGYYRKHGGTEFILHPNTRAAAERELGIDKTPYPDLFPEGFFDQKEYKPGHYPLWGIDAVLLDGTYTGSKEMTIQFRHRRI